MSRIILCLLLLSAARDCFSQENPSVKSKIAFDDTLSLVTEQGEGYIEQPWFGGAYSETVCTKAPHHGMAYENTLSGFIDKVIIINDSTNTSQTLYLSKGTLYKIILNKNTYYSIDHSYYRGDGSEEKDPALLSQFVLDLSAVDLLKKIM